MRYIDWHSHLLPGVDDGSRSVAESLSMLEIMQGQGIHSVVATPHFYADDESVSSFLDKRNASYLELGKELSEDHPRIILGSEVRYYRGISRLNELEKLCVGDSNLLLLEMSTERWTEYTVSELTELAGCSGLRVIIAHMERYRKYQLKKNIERIFDSGILVQCNASYFLDVTSRRKAIAELTAGQIHFIGSDSHGAKIRPPRLSSAFQYISKKVGEEFICDMNSFGAAMLGY